MPGLCVSKLGVPFDMDHGWLLDKDGNRYHTVTIDNRQWITTNLKTTTYADGTAIPNITDNLLWKADITGAYCYYYNDIAYKNEYGILYNWYTVTNIHGLAYFKRKGVQEMGWRIPTIADFVELYTFLGGDDIAGGKLKEIGFTHWNPPNEGATDEVGFKGFGSGNRYIDLHSGDGFSNICVFADFLSSDEFGGDACSVYLDYDAIDLYAGFFLNIVVKMFVV